jgi:predicted Fe-Mo cluster-binding NifX family protein
MKIAIASDDFKTISGHVGQCKGFIIYEIENGNIVGSEKRKNNFTLHSRGKQNSGRGNRHTGGTGGGRGSGNGEGNRQGHQRLAEGLSDCKYLVSLGMGWRLIDDLKSKGVTPIVTAVTDAEEAAIKASKGELVNNEQGVCK